MSKYLVIFLIGVVVVALGLVGYKYRAEILKMKNFFNFKGVDIEKLEQDNKRLKKDINLISIERDLLKPQIEKYEIISDSLTRVDSLNRVELLRIREQNKILERRLQSSKDSVNKYKSVWNENKKKYDKFKKTQKKPSNEQTLEFFKNY